VSAALSSNALVVVKLGGEVVGNAAVLSPIAHDLAALANGGTPVVIVHGGGPQASRLQERLGLPVKQVAGRRVTDADTLDVMKMIVAGKLNVDLCAALLAAGARPVGLHGASACVIQAERRPPRVYAGAGPEPVDLGLVGDVTGVNRELLAILGAQGFVPVLACLGANARGEVFNINADAVANRVAVGLGAAGLFLVSDVPGVLRDVADPASRIERLTVAEGRALIASGAVTKGMIPKLEESFAALAEGVRRIHIVGRLGPGDLAREVERPGAVGTVLVG
jgi:acetylglutamate kinase